MKYLNVLLVLCWAGAGLAANVEVPIARFAPIDPQIVQIEPLEDTRKDRFDSIKTPDCTVKLYQPGSANLLSVISYPDNNNQHRIVQVLLVNFGPLGSQCYLYFGRMRIRESDGNVDFRLLGYLRERLNPTALLSYVGTGLHDVSRVTFFLKEIVRTEGNTGQPYVLRRVANGEK